MINMNVGIDWLDFTVLDAGYSLTQVFEFLGFSDSFFSDTEHGARGYRSMHKLGDYAVIVLSDGREDMGIHVSIGGSAINHVLTHYAQSKHYAPTPFGSDLAADWDMRPILVQFLDEIQQIGHISRLDVCCDDFDACFTPAQLDTYNMNAQIVSKFRTFCYTKEVKSGGVMTGSMFTAGKRGSGVYLRVYDKYLEQLKKEKPVEHEKWIRWEFELRDDRAQEFARLVTSGGELGELFAGLLNNYIRLIDRTSENVSRCPMLHKWAKFTRMVRPLRLYCPPCEKTYDDKREWVESQVLPTLAGIILLDGYEWIDRHMSESLDRMSRSMQDIVDSEYRRREAV